MVALHESKNSQTSGERFAATPAKPLVLIIENHEDTRQMLAVLPTAWNHRVGFGDKGLRLAARVGKKQCEIRGNQETKR